MAKYNDLCTASQTEKFCFFLNILGDLNAVKRERDWCGGSFWVVFWHVTTLMPG